MTEINRQTVACMKLWLEEFEKMIDNQNDVLFMHIYVDNISREISTELKVSCDDRKLQRSKQKTA